MDNPKKDPYPPFAVLLALQPALRPICARHKCFPCADNCTLRHSLRSHNYRPNRYGRFRPRTGKVSQQQNGDGFQWYNMTPHTIKPIPDVYGSSQWVGMLPFTPTVHTLSRAHAASHLALKPPQMEPTLLQMMNNYGNKSHTTCHYIGTN